MFSWFRCILHPQGESGAADLCEQSLARGWISGDRVPSLGDVCGDSVCVDGQQGWAHRAAPWGWSRTHLLFWFKTNVIRVAGGLVSIVRGLGFACRRCAFRVQRVLRALQGCLASLAVRCAATHHTAFLRSLHTLYLPFKTGNIQHF